MCPNELKIKTENNELIISTSEIIDGNRFITKVKNLKCTHTVSGTDNKIVILTEITNLTNDKIYPGDFNPFGTILIESADEYNKVHTVCRDMLGYCGIQDFDKKWTSFGVFGITTSFGDKTLVMGYTDVSDYFYNFTIEKSGDSIIIEPLIPLELSSISPGETLKPGPLVIFSAGGLTDLLKKYACDLSQKMGVRQNDFSQRPSGICSWYEYYGTESQEDVKNLVKEYASLPIGNNLDYFLIDGGWNEDIGDKEFNWGDWESKSKFPEGMKAICDFIHSNGFKSALWISPFAITRNSSIYKTHPDWVTGKGEDLMNNGGEVYGLDISHPEVKEFIRKNIIKIFDEWGFDYIKIDFLLYGAIPGERYDNQFTSAKSFREGMKIISECAGKRFILNCGSPLFQSVGYCDAIRIGPDVGSHWFFPLNENIWQYGNCCIKAGMRYVIFNNWMDSVLWYNDPDCTVARSSSNGIEYTKFKEFFPGMDIKEEDFGLNNNEYLAFLKLVWFTKGVYFLSDSWNFLEKNRQKMLYKFSKSHNQSIKLVDFYQFDDVSLFKTTDGALKIAIFNLSDKSVNFSIPSSHLKMDRWDFNEITENISFAGSGKVIDFPELPPHSGFIYENVL